MKNIVRIISAAAAAFLVVGSMTACTPADESGLAKYLNQNVSWAECDKDWATDVDSQSDEFKAA